MSLKISKNLGKFDILQIIVLGAIAAGIGILLINFIGKFTLLIPIMFLLIVRKEFKNKALICNQDIKDHLKVNIYLVIMLIATIITILL